jgi:hypothetical protein
LDPAPFTLMAEVAAVLADAGETPRVSGPVLAPLLSILTGPAWPADLERFSARELERLDGVIGLERATGLADVLHRRKLLPFWNRLPRLLATDAPRLARLVRDAAEFTSARSLAWARCVCEAMFGCLDAGTEAPPIVAQEFQALLEADTPHSIRIESYQARLRQAARQNPEAALPLLREACREVGVYEVDLGLEAVLGRLAMVNRKAWADFVKEHADGFAEKALFFRAGVWADGNGTSRADLAILVGELERLTAEKGITERDSWTAAFELLAAAARLGGAGAAERIIYCTGPPLWTVLNATWAPARRRALEGDREACVWVDRVDGAPIETGAGPASENPPPAPYWSKFPWSLQVDYWHLRALPVERLPWWTPWGAGLP